jgi:ribosomal protein L20
MLFENTKHEEIKIDRTILANKDLDENYEFSQDVEEHNQW